MKVAASVVYFGLPSTNKEAAIRLAGEKLVENDLVETPYIESMLAKEKSDMTYIGNGIAIPHGLNEDKKFVKESGIVILHFPQGIQYDEQQVFLLIGIAGKDDEHLTLLQDIAIKLSDQMFVESLVQSTSQEEFLSLFNEDNE